MKQLRDQICAAAGAVGVCAAGLLTAMTPASAEASTIVRMSTTLGDIDLQLFDEVTPITTANFMSYATSDRWDGSFFHRSLAGFVLQGGGFTFDPVGPSAPSVVTDAPIVNEFNISNTRGTVAMAKLGGDPDSATSQFFFNLADNSSNLDNQNGGFTVFAQVLGDGMDVVDAITALQIYDLDGTSSSLFDAVPLLNATDPLADVLVFVNDVTVLASRNQGDIDGNGLLEDADVMQLVSAFADGTTLADAHMIAAADANLDGIVNLSDIELLANTYTASSVSTGALLTLVPEPGAAVLLTLGAAGVLGGRRRKQA